MRSRIPDRAKLAANFGDWALYELRHEGSLLWYNFKLMLPPTVRAKWGEQRVYKLAWNPAEQRLARSAQSHALEQRAPELLAQLENHLRAFYTRDWLVSNQGMTESEIATECDRLAAEKRSRRRARASQARANEAIFE